MICLHDMIFFIPLYGIGGGDPAVVRKELSDVLKHEIFRSGSVLRSTFFTILSLLLAAKKYVGEHYMDSALSLDGTAAQLGISPSYLSRIFSEVDGKRFTQYLSDLRIEPGEAPARGREQAGARRRAGGRLPDRPELHAGLQVQDRRAPQ